MTSDHSPPIQDQRSDYPEISATRRKALAALLFAACGALLYKLGSLTFWFLKPPRRPNEFGGTIAVGPIRELPPPGAAPVHYPRGRFWLIHDDKGISAVHSACTHLDCLFSWDTEKQVFVCPCHGSEFSRNGHVLRGPAPRDLDRFPVRLIDEQDQVIAQSAPDNASPLEISELLPTADENSAQDAQQKQVVVTLLVDTGTKISGDEQRFD